MDVPDRVLVEVGLSIQALTIFCPGAKTSITDPKLEGEVRESEMIVAPTVMAEGTRAGEKFEASAFEFPAATTT